MLKALAKIITIATLLPFAGCSLAMRRVPYTYRADQGEPSCSGSFLPTVDTIAAAGFALAGAAALGGGGEEEPYQCQTIGCADAAAVAIVDTAADAARIMAGVTALAIATVYTVSAVHGHRNASQCHEAQAAHEDWVAGRTSPADVAFVPALPAKPPVPEFLRVGDGAECREHTDCQYGYGCDPTGHRCVKLP